MRCETVYKKLKPGTLVRVNRLNAYGIIISTHCSWPTNITSDPFCYVILVKGKEVKAYGEGITTIGD